MTASQLQNSTVSSLQQIIRAEDAQFAPLCGRFHAHLTLIFANADDTSHLLSEIQDCAAQYQSKLTIIELESQRSQRDVMTTSYFVDSKPGAVFRIAQRLIDFCMALEQLPVKVVRAKLEHESLPSLPVFSQTQYHEVHIKTLIEQDRFADLSLELQDLLQSSGFRISRNPREQRGQSRVQFLNGRFYRGCYAEVSEQLRGLLDELANYDMDILEVKRETVVFDTALSHDHWWL